MNYKKVRVGKPSDCYWKTVKLKQQNYSEKQ